MNWLKEMMGLPEDFHGVIQDTASTGSLVAILSARERISEFQINAIGFLTNNTVYIVAQRLIHPLRRL